MPSHLILKAGFDMELATAAEPSKPYGKGVRWTNAHAKWDAVQKGAVVLATDDNDAVIMHIAMPLVRPGVPEKQTLREKDTGARRKTLIE